MTPDDSARTGEPWSRTLPGAMRAIDEARYLAEAFCEAHDAAPRVTVALTLVLEELITNTVTHGGASGNDAIRVSLWRDGTDICIEHHDRGAPFDPRAKRGQATAFADLDEQPVGGLGWTLIAHYCRIEDYCHADGENRVRLRLGL